MRETLFIRLGSAKDHPVYWMVQSELQKEVIASGILARADDLTTLDERITDRRLVVLVPGCDITVHRVALPAKGQKQALKALPFLAEEFIAEEIDRVHLTLIEHDDKQATVVAVNRQKMADWLAWLNAAGLTPEQMLPDWLSLPAKDGQAHALQLGTQWILRFSRNSGMTVDKEQLTCWLPLIIAEHPEFSLISHTPWPVDAIDAEESLDEIPLAALANGKQNNNLNLLHSGFAVKKQRSLKFQAWRSVAILAGVGLLLHISNGLIAINQLHSEKQQIQQQLLETYQQAFPKEKKIKVKQVNAMLKQKLTAIGGSTEERDSMLASFEAMLPAFQKQNKFQISSLRYTAKNKEIRMQTLSGNFEDYEKLKQQLSEQFDVELSALSSVQNKVRGEIVLRSKR